MTPEGTLKSVIKAMMRKKSWTVYDIGASKFGDRGLPDWYCTHKIFKDRWIEIKYDPGGYSLSGTQRKLFRDLYCDGIGVWVLTKENYMNWEVILLGSPNWMDFLRV